MYAGSGFRAFEIGDVDVVLHDGVFHLFHLVLPNHDYIAHAVSKDGLSWRRAPNALFISDPGTWDDDMLWTMHVSPDPHRPRGWRMFYTGLSMQERGRIQRVGLARSDDLYHWEKVPGPGLPLEAAGPHYESGLDDGRGWVSFRDPFFLRDGGEGYLLVGARASDGPVIRRGCVALAEEVEQDRFELREPLYHPRRYDDVEVPGLFRIGERFYLIGSIREDVKVHYWYARDLRGPYKNLHDNVLMPQGNYAARVLRDPESGRLLVWNFFFKGAETHREHLLPPPKELVAEEDGRLHLRSYRGFDDRVTEVTAGEAATPVDTLYANPGAEILRDGSSTVVDAQSGFEAFLLRRDHRDFRLSGTMALESNGKFGLVTHLDEEGNGYYISLDPFKGITQIRWWAANPTGGIEEAFTYDQLQSSNQIPRPGPIPFSLISYGTYIELSLHGNIVLTLADERRHEGRVGFYVESSRLRVSDLVLETLDCPEHDPYVSPDSAETMA